MNDQFILASTSPIRASILAQAGYHFKTVGPNVNEQSIKEALVRENHTAQEIATHLAAEKARVISLKHVGQLVVGADQTLEHEGALVDKAADLNDLRKSLKQLCGKSHSLHSAATIHKDGEELFSACQTAEMTMRVLSDEFLDAYISSVGQSVLGCVGGYMFEDRGVHLFSCVDGDYYTVLGLPMIKLSAGLDQLGVRVFP